MGYDFRSTVLNLTAAASLVCPVIRLKGGNLLLPWQQQKLFIILLSRACQISSNKSQTYFKFLLTCLQDVPLAGVIRGLGGAGAALPALPQRDVSGAGAETADAGSPGWSDWCVC